MLGFIKTLHLVHVRRADQPPVEAIGPSMIRTLNRGRVAILFLAQPRPAVTADVVESAHPCLLIANTNQTFTGHLLDEIIPSFGNLTLMPDEHPLAGEDFLLFLCKNLR